MYKYLLAIPLIIFPYWLLFLLYCLLTGTLMEEVFLNNVYLLIAALVAGGIICFFFMFVFWGGAVGKK